MKKFFIFTIPLFLAHIADAACAGAGQYELLVPIGTLSGCVDLGTYIKGMFETVIGIAGILAVVMIVYCGIKLMTSGSAGGKSEAKECITNALFGVLLAVGSWLTLNTINPLLLAAKPSTIGIVAPPLDPSSPTPLPPTGVVAWKEGPSCPALAGNIATVIPDTSCPGVKPTPTSVCCEYREVPLAPPAGSGGAPVIPPVISPYSPDPTSGSVWTDTTILRVKEDAGVATVIVRRAGNIAGSIDYSLVAGSATAGADYGNVSGTLNFPSGVSQLSVAIPIVDDLLVEGDENFYFKLSNPLGGLTLGNPNKEEIIILDNDVAPPDITPPIVSILFPVGGASVVTTTPMVSTKVNVVEDTKLASVKMYTYLSGGTSTISTVTGCGPGLPCPPTGGIFNMPASKIGPKYNEYYDFVAKACDDAGNCGWATSTIGYTAECINSTNATTSYRCFTLPSGNGATTSPTIPGRTNAHLIKLTGPLGGGSVSITTIAPSFDYYGENCTDFWGDVTWCGYGCAGPAFDSCNLVPTVPVCGGIPCIYGCAVDHFTASCNLVPQPPMCGGISCPTGCAVDPTVAECFTPDPSVISSLSTWPQDLSMGAPCGNGRSSTGEALVRILFGGAGPCVLKPYFNYFLDITGSDGNPHNFLINYDWDPVNAPAAAAVVPPTVPVITQTSAGNAGDAINFQFSSIHPSGLLFRYQIDWNGDGIIDQTIPAAAPTGGAWGASHTWAAPQVANIKARAIDVSGNVSAWGSLQVVINSAVVPTIFITAPAINPVINLGQMVNITSYGNYPVAPFLWSYTFLWKLDAGQWNDFSVANISNLNPGNPAAIPHWLWAPVGGPPVSAINSSVNFTPLQRGTYTFMFAGNNDGSAWNYNLLPPAGPACGNGIIYCSNQMIITVN